MLRGDRQQTLAGGPPPWPRAGPLAGVDEAGRGPVLGPLVVAAVLVPSERAALGLGVRDSKKLAPARREALDAGIRERWPVAVRVLGSDELDHEMTRRSLNQIEAEAFAGVLSEVGAPRAYVDAADTVAARFGDAVSRHLGHRVPVRAEHHADERRACVAAASIVAKVERDRRVAALAREYGAEFGSGYVHDERTMAWLRGFVRANGELPACARRMWAPARALLDEARQGRLP